MKNHVMGATIGRILLMEAAFLVPPMALCLPVGRRGQKCARLFMGHWPVRRGGRSAVRLWQAQRGGAAALPRRQAL